MINNIKILFIDLDGTTLDVKIKNKRTLSNKNKKAILQARSKDMEIIISTGGIGQRFHQVAKEIGGNYFIQANGALITDKNNQVLFEKKLEKKQVIKILKLAKKYKLFLFPSLSYCVYGVSNLIVKYIIEKNNFKTVKNYKLNCNIKYHKISLFGFLFKSKIEKLTTIINQRFNDLIAVTTAKGYAIEISVKEVTKGAAANFIAKKLGYSKNQIAHIGDSMNDATTMPFVGTLIAMKNADYNLKLIANYIAPHYKNGGLAKFLNGQYTKNKFIK